MACQKLSLVMVAMVVTVTLGASMDSEEKGNNSPAIFSRHAKRRSVDGMPERFHVCGLRLLETLRGVCGGFRASRRSDPMLSPLYEYEMPMSNALEDQQYQSDGFPQDSSSNFPDFSDSGADFGGVGPWRGGSSMSPTGGNKLLALKILTEAKGHPRYRRNVIDACCKQPCTYVQMMKYCDNRL